MRATAPIIFVALVVLTCGCRKKPPPNADRAGAPAGPTAARDAGPSHRAVVEALLDKGTVDIYLDPRRSGVIVPAKYRADNRLILKIGRDMPVPIPDLRVTDDRVSGTLSFDQQPFFCSVPWTAVFAAVGEDGRGMVWEENMPIEVRDGGADSGSASRP